MNAAFFLCFIAPSLVATENPSALSLLMGLEESRSSIRSGRIVLSIQEIDPLSQSVEDNENVELTIVFDGARRFCKQKTQGLTISGAKLESEHDVSKFLNTKSRSEIVKTGIGRIEDIESRLIHDRDRTIIYEKSYGAKCVNADASPYYNFDPRCLGFDVYLKPMENDLHGFFEYYYPGSVAPKFLGTLQLVGKEVVAGHQTWHVLGRLAGQEREYWIDSTNGYKIFKYRNTSQFMVSEAISEYGPTMKVPSKIEIRAYERRDNKLKFGMNINVLSQQFNVPVDSSEFALANLRMPIGQAVNDVRSKLAIIGYWNGETLIPEWTSQRPKEIGKTRGFVYVNGALFVGAVVIALILYNRRRK